MQSTSGVVFTSLPGPTRKRQPSPYCYRLTYRDPQPHEPGCVLMWDVYGGRQEYQIALERETTGKLRWHCTCADAVYRGEDAPHTCKHVRGLRALGRQPSADSYSPRQVGGYQTQLAHYTARLRRLPAGRKPSPKKSN